MPLLTKVRSLLRNLFSLCRVENDLEQEMHSHLEMLTDENVREGMGRSEAERAARIELGGIEQVKEQVREQRIGNWLRSVRADSRFALRQLRKSPGFTVVAILTLGLGIGSTTAIFSAIDGALLHPYGYRDAERLAAPVVFSGDQFRAWRFPARAFVDFKQKNHTFEDMFGLVYHGVRIARAQSAEEVSGGSVTPGTFESLGIPALLGRTLTDDDHKSGAAPVFVISEGLWTKLFNRVPKVVGATYTLNGTRTTLVGIMPPRFQIGGCDLWMPINITRDSFVPGAGIQSNEIWTVGHLKRGISPETAAADLQVIATPFQNDDPIYFPAHFKIVVDTFNSEPVSPDYRRGFFALMAAVSLLLLIACSNVANLLLARATTRTKEFGIRSALGANRLRLIRQLLVESFLLAGASCTLGFLFAFWGLKAIVALIPSGTIPPEAAISISSTALLFSLTVTVLTALGCGIAPAFHVLHFEVQTALSITGSGISADVRHARLRSTLVIAEVALSIVLAICSGLFLRSLFALQNVNLGFNPSKVVYAQISLPEGQYDSAAQQQAFFCKVLDRLGQDPGVLAATVTSSFPPHTWGWTTVVIQGQAPPQNRNTAFIMCTEDYFKTTDRHLVRGTLFTRNDVDSARHAAVVNQTFASDRFGEENPIGHQVRFSDFETLADWPRDPYFEIIGVVADAKNAGLQDLPEPEIYLPVTLTAAGPHNLMVRATVYPQVLLGQIRIEISAVDPNVAVGETGTIATLLQHDYYARPRFLLITLCAFAVIAILLVAVGVFSVISYAVVLQTREIGIRMALGAQPRQVLGSVLRKGARLIVAGVVTGLFTSYLVTRLLASQIWGVSAADPSTFVVVALLALSVGVLACLSPARRAARVDPMVALRYE